MKIIFMNFKDYLEVNELTEKKFFDKWLNIIRETKEGQKYINKVLDYQNDDVGEYIGFERNLISKGRRRHYFKAGFKKISAK